MDIRRRIAPQALNQMRLDLEEAEGREVLWVGKVGADDLIHEVLKIAEGTLEAVAFLRPLAEQGDVILHNHPSGHLQPSQPDLRIAHHLGEWGVGFGIVDNALQRITMVAEPLPLPRTTPLDPDALAALLQPGGALSRQVGYEHRPSQVDMLRAVAEAFNRDQHLVVEAGTGVGKSYAYLLPAVAWAAHNRQRVVISTGTIHLQRQILEKDIPVVQRLLGTEERVELVKGRSNYLCPARLREAWVEADAEQRRLLEPFLKWAEITPSGDREDWSGPLDQELWKEICSEKEICAGFRCGLREDCFVARARKRAASARVLVVNHHLLFADLSLRFEGLGFEGNALLPPFKRLVLDEAHRLEESATSYFSWSIGRSGVIRLSRRFWRTKKRKKLGVLAHFLEKAPLPAASLTALSQSLHQAAERMAQEAGAALGSEAARRVQRHDPTLESLLQAGSTLVERLRKLEEVAAQTYQRLTAQDQDAPAGWELKHLVGRLGALTDNLKRFLRLEDDDVVHWIEREPSGEGRLVLSPLELGPFLFKTLLEPMKTTVAASATLTVRGSFDHFLGQIGARDCDRVSGRVFDSPFDYARRVLLAVPTDLSPPDSPSWLEGAMEVAANAIRISHGGALLLFTSYDTLHRARAALGPVCAELGIPLLWQGQASNAEVLKRFKDGTDSILLATYGFWEGVDAPGETLRLLVIAKLPFTVPTDPITVARSERLRRQGRDPFVELSLPSAILRFKQGFGRLMRRSDDGGAVLVLDSRLAHKAYGLAFLESLPPARRILQPTTEVIAAIRRFYQDL